MKIFFSSECKEISESKVYIYGAGELAHDTVKWLRKYDINVSALIIDDEFYNGDRYSNSVKQISLSHYMEHCNDGVIIYCIASPRKLRDIMNADVFKSIYIIFNTPGLWHYDDEWYGARKKDFDAVYSCFSDELSAKVMHAFIEAHKTGDATGLIETMVDDIYFNDLVSKEYVRKGSFVDCGACTGDTITKFNRWIEETSYSSYAFEPDEKNFMQLIENVDEKTVCLKSGTWNETGELCFSANGNMASKICDTGDSVIKVDSIDNVVGDNKVSFIKLDVEGSELETLCGAEKTICRDMPILAVSAYHKKNDLIDLPKKIMSFNSGKKKYKIYLRNHSFVAAELVLYAIPVMNEN